MTIDVNNLSVCCILFNIALFYQCVYSCIIFIYCIYYIYVVYILYFYTDLYSQMIFLFSFNIFHKLSLSRLREYTELFKYRVQWLLTTEKINVMSPFFVFEVCSSRYLQNKFIKRIC